MNGPDKNIIDAIENRLKQLQQEKEQIEEEYGINQDVLLQYSTNPKSDKYSTNINKTHKYAKSINYDTLPKLDPPKKDALKQSYKTPETLQDSLKYEPNIKDLLDDEEFEPSFTNLNSLQISPSIPKGFNTEDYIAYLMQQHINSYIK